MCRTRSKRTPSRHTSKELPTHSRLSVTELGTAIRIDYSARGKARTHGFTKSAKLYASSDGKALIIAPVRVSRGEIQD